MHLYAFMHIMQRLVSPLFRLACHWAALLRVEPPI